MVNRSMFDGTTSRTSTSLIRSARENDAAAWQRLVRTYSRRIYRWCRQAGLQSADASNTVQEVLRAVARSLPDFQHDRDGDTFRGWIRRITQNKLKDHFRKQNRQAEKAPGGTDAHRRLGLLAAPSHEGSDQATTAKIDEGLLQQLQLEFSHRDWTMFWRIVVDGQSAVEVAKEFDVTANTVRIVKMRVLKKLRTRLLHSD